MHSVFNSNLRLLLLIVPRRENPACQLAAVPGRLLTVDVLELVQGKSGVGTALSLYEESTFWLT